MAVKKILLSFLAVFLFTFPLLPSYALEGPYDHSVFDAFLKTYVDDQGHVNYAAVKQNPQLLDDYLQRTGAVIPMDFDSWPREEKLAFWLNVYLASVIKLIIHYYPVTSIQHIPGFWETSVLRMGKESFNLNQIRTEKLIEPYRDEKIHAVLACGAKDCPGFPQEAFTGPRVEGQLFVAARRFVNNPKFVRILPGEKNVYLSRIFKWYENDFTLDFGSSDSLPEWDRKEAAIISFIVYYLEDLQKIEFLEKSKFKLKYFDFDWALDDGSVPPEKNEQ